MNTCSKCAIRPTKMIKLWVLIAISLSGVFAQADSPLEPAVESLLKRTLQQHPTVLSAQAEKQASQSDLTAAQMQLLPTLGLQSEFRQKSQGTNVGVLSLEQPLWTFGALTGRIAQAEHLSQAATLNTLAVKESVASQYFDVVGALMTAHQTHSAKLQHLQSHRRYEGMMQRRVDAQVAAGVEMDLLTTRMLSLDMEVQSAASAVEIQVNKLSHITGVKLNSADVALLSQPIGLNELKAWRDRHELGVWMARLEEMPQVQRTLAELDAAKSQVNVKQALRWPTLSARYEYQVQGDRDPGQSKDRYWIGLSYSPGAGLSSFANASAEEFRLASSVAKVDEIKRNVTEEIQTEWTRLNTAIGNADLIERAMTSSRAVHESYERQFEAGRKSWLDLLNTLRETQAQEIQWIQAVGAAQVAHNKLRLKSGEWIHQP